MMRRLRLIRLLLVLQARGSRGWRVTRGHWRGELLMDVIEVVSLPRDLLALDVAAAMEQTDARKCESSPRTGATF
jgi:hypothetical protein